MPTANTSGTITTSIDFTREEASEILLAAAHAAVAAGEMDPFHVPDFEEGEADAIQPQIVNATGGLVEGLSDNEFLRLAMVDNE